MQSFPGIQSGYDVRLPSRLTEGVIDFPPGYTAIYTSDWRNVTLGAQHVFYHGLGHDPVDCVVQWQCISPESNWRAGDVIIRAAGANSNVRNSVPIVYASEKLIVILNTTSFKLWDRLLGTTFDITVASWRIRVVAK